MNCPGSNKCENWGGNVDFKCNLLENCDPDFAMAMLNDTTTGYC